MKLKKTLCLIALLFSIFSSSVSEAMGIEVWKGQARWKILCLYIQQPKYFFCDSQFLFHVYEDGDIKRLKGKGEGKFLTDRLIGFFKPSKDETIIYTWYPKEKTFSFDVTGIKGKGYLLLKLFPSKLDAPLFPCEEWFPEFLEIKDLKHAETIHVKALWDGIVMATAPDFQGIRIEAKDGATRKIQYRDEGMLLVEANIKIEKEECITVIDSIYGDITANGKKIDNPYLSGKTRIKTGKGASIRLNLPDGSTMKIGSDTEFEFNAECSGKKPQQIAVSEYVKVFLGKMWIIISRPRPKSFFNIQTPTCAMGVRGTKFSVEVRKTKGMMETIVEVEEGEIEVKEFKTNKIYIVKAGEKFKT